MAIPRFATLAERFELEESIILTFSYDPDDGGAYLPGKYIIVNTGVQTSEGKVIKRPYSLMQLDDENKFFKCAIKMVTPYLGCDYLKKLNVGDTLQYSGPWGKFRTSPEHKPNLSTVVMASDTGITAALGLVAQETFQPHLKDTKLVWLYDKEKPFLSVSVVKDFLNKGLNEFICINRNDADLWKQWIKSQGHIDQQYLVGDGAVISHWRQQVDEKFKNTVSVCEYFYNKPKD